MVKVYINALIQPYFDYCSEVWDCLNEGLRDHLQKLQNRAARLIMNLKNEHGQSVIARKLLGWITLKERRTQMKAKLMYKIINGLAPQRLCEIFNKINEIHNYNLQGFLTRLYIPKPKTEFLKDSFGYSGANGTKYPKRYATRVRLIRVVMFLHRPQSSLYRNISL